MHEYLSKIEKKIYSYDKKYAYYHCHRVFKAILNKKNVKFTNKHEIMLFCYNA